MQSGQTSFRTFLVFLQLSAWRAIVAGKPSFHRYLMPSARRSTLTWNMASMSFYHFINFISLLTTYILWSKTSSVIPFWRAFLMPMKGARSKVPLTGHFKWLSKCQDWLTKSGCHLRILKLETWNFAWDLILLIHMLYKKRGSIWKLFEKLAQPNDND